jgi:nitric oxide reductase NorE protein
MSTPSWPAAEDPVLNGQVPGEQAGGHSTAAQAAGAATGELFFKDPFAHTYAKPKTSGAPNGRPRSHVPGEVGIWVFVLGDMCAFALFFSVFVLTRTQQPAVFELGRRSLTLALGTINTLLLLTGSFMVVVGLRYVRRLRQRIGSRFFAVALFCGLCFVGNKVIEYHGLIHDGHKPASNDFYTYFFMFTGVHLLHLTLGLGGLGFMVKTARKPAIAARDLRNLEALATYWHLIDLLWIVLFALLYLLR